MFRVLQVVLALAVAFFAVGAGLLTYTGQPERSLELVQLALLTAIFARVHRNP